ncbi:sortilin-like [Thalassophryne amazonica]|uniref:sortilin-like n=1 Tax=Thalassophryne amazonica TaxID=390379 RepID=UPI001471EA91|nr:sortilin-like [Thalassophryne amazonica]
MGLFVRCIGLLSIVILTAGLAHSQHGLTGSIRNLNMEKRLADLHVGSGVLAASPRHKINRRSVQQGCKDHQGFNTKLEGNTHSFVFRDTSVSVSLAWVGDGKGVILALTTFSAPLFLLRSGQSRLYRSENYGKSFQDVTTLINNTFIRTDYGITIDPENSGKVILVGELSGLYLSRIFVSSDFGKSFTPHALPFFPVSPVTYDPEDSNVLVAISKNNDLWLSENFGSSWRNIHNSVCVVKWGRKSTLFFTAHVNGSCIDRGMLELKRSTDHGKTVKTISNKIYSFGMGGRFIFASVMTGKGTLRMIHVSVDQGDVWNMAQLPAVSHEQFYSILAANDEMVFIHVDEEGDTDIGTVYVSDDRGLVYSKSLERHLYITTGGDTDFTNVTSLRGVFITSVLSEDGSVQSVVSFDQGGEWVPLQTPANSKCNTTGRHPVKCSLYIHGAFGMSQKTDIPMLPLTESNAVGLILAHGTVGDTISVLTPDVYVSDDGGYTWMKALEGPHHYAILDSGGLLVAVEHKPTQTINKIKFSTDEGQCWSEYTFTTDPIYFTGLASEPGARSMNVSIWGYRTTFFGLSSYWVSVTIDFRELLTRDCTKTDYVQWLAHSNDISSPNDGCVLGYKEKFLRLKKDTVCWNGRDYQINTQPTPCPCTYDDFLCDFGYYREENSSVCLEQPDLQGKMLEYCLHGKLEQLVTSGYRKIPGDRCEGGLQPDRKEIDLSRACVSDSLQQNVMPQSKSVAVVVPVTIVLLLSIVAGVFIVKKRVCGGRFLVHRYSLLQQHAEETPAEGVDDQLETNHTPNGKIEFHDDSDEDMLE